MSKLNKLRMGIAAAGFGAAMLLAPVVAQAKEVNIRVQAVLGRRFLSSVQFWSFSRSLQWDLQDRLQAFSRSRRSCCHWAGWA